MPKDEVIGLRSNNVPCVAVRTGRDDEVGVFLSVISDRSKLALQDMNDVYSQAVF